MRALNVFFLAALALFGATVPALAQAPEAPTPTPAPQAAPARQDFAPVVDAQYVLGLGDVVEVAVVGQSDYSARARVSPDGNVLLPLIGNVPAVNVRPADLATQISARLTKGGYFSQAVVRVEVITVASRFVTVLGQVGSPGLIPLDRGYHLSEILARVGARFGAGAEYVVITRANGQQEKLTMNDIATGGPAQDPIVTPGDKIYVPAAEAQTFYVSGAVKSPGVFPVAQGMTVRMALARAGGVTENGNEKKLEIYRQGKKVPKANLETLVEVGDIVKFGERMF